MYKGRNFVFRNEDIASDCEDEDSDSDDDGDDEDEEKSQTDIVSVYETQFFYR